MTSFDDLRSAHRDALLALSEFIRVDGVIQRQLSTARREFFVTPPAASDPGFGAAAQRFLEWFSLERRIEGSGGAPIHAFLGAGCPGLLPGAADFADALASSFVGVFLVEDSDAEGLELRDSISGDTLYMFLPAKFPRPDCGDTLVGRLVPVPGTDGYLGTETMERYPGSSVFEACFEEAEERRLAADVPEPLSQREIERWIEITTGETHDSVAELEAELATYLGDEPDPAKSIPGAPEISYALSRATSPGHVLGPLLEEIAFHTDLDIETGQRLMLRLWNAHHSAGEPTHAVPEEPSAPAPPRTIDGKQILNELDAGLARHEDLETLFARLEAMVDDAAGDEDPSEDDGVVGGPGNLEGLVTEYLWERSSDDDEASMLRRCIDLLRSQGIDDAEAIEESALTRFFAGLWSEGRDRECSASLRAIASFGEWLRDQHSIETQCDIPAWRLRIEDELTRAKSLASQLGTGSNVTAQPRVWKVVSGGRRTAWRLESEGSSLDLAPDLELRVGDWIVGSAGEQRFAPGLRVVPWGFADQLA